MVASSKGNHTIKLKSKIDQAPRSLPNNNIKNSISLDSLDDILDSKFLNSLSDPSRVAVLKRVIQIGRGDVSRIAIELPWDKSVISRNLSYLHEAGILKRNKIGKQVFYEPDILNILSKFKEITNGIETIIETCCPITIPK
jgi:predicted transcriptional regulator